MPDIFDQLAPEAQSNGRDVFDEIAPDAPAQQYGIKASQPSLLDQVRGHLFGSAAGETALGRAFPSLAGGQISDTPNVDLPLVRFEAPLAPDASLPAYVAHGINQVASGLTTPKNLAILAGTGGLGSVVPAAGYASVAAKTANAALGAYFTYQMGAGATDAMKAAYAAHQAGNDNEAARLLGFGTVSGLLAAAGLFHARASATDILGTKVPTPAARPLNPEVVSPEAQPEAEPIGKTPPQTVDVKPGDIFDAIAPETPAQPAAEVAPQTPLAPQAASGDVFDAIAPDASAPEQSPLGPHSVPGSEVSAAPNASAPDVGRETGDSVIPSSPQPASEAMTPSPAPRLEDARFPDKTAPIEVRTQKALEYAQANPDLKPATLQRRFGLGYGAAADILKQAAIGSTELAAADSVIPASPQPQPGYTLEDGKAIRARYDADVAAQLEAKYEQVKAAAVRGNWALSGGPTPDSVAKDLSVSVRQGQKFLDRWWSENKAASGLDIAASPQPAAEAMTPTHFATPSPELEQAIIDRARKGNYDPKTGRPLTPAEIQAANDKNEESGDVFDAIAPHDAVNAVSPETGEFPLAGATASGLRVEEPDERDLQEHINRGSFSEGYKVLPGVREVPISAFTNPMEKLNVAADRRLQKEIEQSGAITPIVALARPSQPGRLILVEGVHRLSTLARMGKVSIPATIVSGEVAETPGTTPQPSPSSTIEADASAVTRTPQPARATDSPAPSQVLAEDGSGAGAEGNAPQDDAGLVGSGGGTIERPPRQGSSGRRGLGAGEESGLPTSGAGDLTHSTGSNDYRISADDHVGEGTPREKLRSNLDAIRIVKALATEKRPATPDEKRQLARYVGWGSMPQIFDPYRREWSGAREELESLLTPDELKAARASTTNAHYTSPAVVQGIWKAVERLGLTPHASVLEPSMGIGHFFGLQPDSLLPARRTGVEMDAVSGQIAKALYPDSNIQISPFEKLPLPHDFFDAAIGNVPFGNYGVHDPAYRKTPLATSAIHNYFFVKALDTLRPGGILAFVTSSYTMDATKWRPVRELLASKADLLGAIRLPNTAFKSNAGTEVTTDLIILQKRAPGAPQGGEAWEELGTVPTADGRAIPVNEYYAKHPEMMLGKMSYAGTMYAGDTPTLEGELTPELLDAAIAKLPEKVYRAWSAEEGAPAQHVSAVDLGDEVKDGGYTVKDGVLAQRDGAIYRPIQVAAPVEKRIRALLPVRAALREVYRTQLADEPEKRIVAARKKLNLIYDAFVKQHGPINKPVNVSAFRLDPDLPPLQALEDFDKKTGKATKRQIFTERTIQKPSRALKADKPDEALAIVLNELGRIDWDRMQELTGKTPEELRTEMAGLVYKNPAGGKWETADAYLSGNVREKLEQAEAVAAADPAYQPNVEALKAVIPADIPQDQIRVGLGAVWIPPDVVQKFAREVLAQDSARVNYSPQVATWAISTVKYEANRAANRDVWGNEDFSGHELLEMALNNKSPKVYFPRVGDDRPQINPIRTAAAQALQDALRQKFAEWVWEDDQRAAALTTKYNREMNALRNREFDGSHLTLPGSNPGIKLKPHQKNAVWRALQTGNTLLAHEVGAGKTFEMVATAMEMRRLGLARKPMVVVPNHMIEQFQREWLQLYPNARILAVDREDMGKHRRQVALARMSSGNYDGLIVAHSSFGKIGVSDETFRNYLESQIADLRIALREANGNAGDDGRRGGKPKKDKTVKEIEKSIKRLETKIQNRAKREDKDKSLTFEQLGVDQLFVDEAHAYKKLPIITSRERIAGIPTGDSQRATDMHMKTQYVSAPSGAKRGIVFATGTPITNTMAEMYNMQRFLQPKVLEAMGLQHFDAWANTFARAQRGVELDVSGKTFRENTRFSKFINLPELASMFRQMADVKTAAELKLPRPEVEGGGTQPMVVEATPEQTAFIDSLVQRALKIRGGGVDPKQDNMLKITSEGKKAALDMRLVDPLAHDHHDSKVNTAVRGIFDIWKETAANRSTQLVFCDLSTPKSTKAKKPLKKPAEAPEADDDDSDALDLEKTDFEAAGERAGFSVYDDMRAKLIAAGIPSKEIAFIHDYPKDADKAELFLAVNAGEIRVLFGSTEKMGVGTNVQKKAFAMWEMDTPWRPSDVIQREGRILRQGNENPTVRIYQMLTSGSLDAFSWQTLTTKAGFIGQAMSGDPNLREVEDVGLVIPSAGEFMAAASGDPIIKENIGVTAELGRLSAQRAGHARQQAAIQRQMRELPSQIENATRIAKNIAADVATVKKHETDGFTIGKRQFSGEKARAEAASALHQTLESWRGPGNPQHIGSYRGLALWTRPAYLAASLPSVTIRGESSYEANVNPEDPLGTLASIESVVRNIPGRLPGWETTVAEQTKKLADLGRAAEKKFPFESRFQELQKRKAEIDVALSQTSAERAAHSADDGESETGAEASGAEASGAEASGAAEEPEEVQPSTKVDKPQLKVDNQDDEDSGVTLGSGLGALDPYVRKFLKSDVMPKVRQVVEILHLAKDDILKIAAPAARKGAQKGSLSARHRAAELARSRDRTEAALRIAGKYIGSLPDAERWAFVDRMEHGSAQPNPDLQAIADVIRPILDTRRAEIQALGTGKLQAYIENYYPHIWENPKLAAQLIQNHAKSPLQGSKSFLKKRTIETISDGLALGLTPAFSNPIEMVVAKAHEMDKYLMAHRIMADNQANGQRLFKRANAPMPAGWAKLNDSVATVWGAPSHPGAQQIEGEYIFPEPVARVLNNYLMPSLHSKSGIYKMLMGAANTLNQAQLGVSGFHAIFTSTEAATSKLSLAFYMAGHGDIGKALKTAAQAPLAPITTFRRGREMSKEWYFPGTQTPLIQELVDATVQAGGRAHMESFYRTHMGDRMMAAWREGNVFGAMGRAPFAAFEAPTRLIMEGLVPKLKLGAFADLAQYELEKLGTNASDPDVQAALAKAWDSIDNRFGQFVYDNVFWNKYVKDLAMLMVRSLGWTGGELRELGGGYTDAARFAVELAKLGKGKGRPEFTHRMSYIPAHLLVHMAAGAMLYYLWHKRVPHKLIDYFFPPDAHGRRQSPPTYVKDEANWVHQPMRTAEGKLNPLITFSKMVLTNRDYFDKPIMNPHHHWPKEVRELAEFVLKQFEPIWLQQLQQKQNRNPSLDEKLMPEMGITRAPKWVGQHSQR